MHGGLLCIAVCLSVCPDHRGVVGFLVRFSNHLLATFWFCWLPWVCWLHCVFSVGLLAYQANKKHKHFRTKNLSVVSEINSQQHPYRRNKKKNKPSTPRPLWTGHYLWPGDRVPMTFYGNFFAAHSCSEIFSWPIRHHATIRDQPICTSPFIHYFRKVGSHQSQVAFLYYQCNNFSIIVRQHDQGARRI